MALAPQSPATDAHGRLTIRPAWSHAARLVVLLAGLALITILGIFKASLGVPNALSPRVWLVLFVVAAGGLSAWEALSLLGSQITVTYDAVVVTRRFRSTRIDIRDIARVVRCGVATGFWPKAVRLAIFVLAPSGRCVLSLYVERWGAGDLDRIWDFLGVAPEGSLADIVDKPELERRFPRAF